ncbi:LapD/MoxY N-terminal periplasmic domain-containing protein [Arcobacter aquimarinus]|uniref:Diguanylate cyclase/phosphodiesterase (LapD/MoxY domain) n=1 Tax=Arcobacter aquimarinus TaxID=1315211 RepID=A0AAE7B1N2_9BACT|nr:LapD/MoxY N-terminal periplasmic domain-containing protein [Arcobacter aquimarinus]QKE25709.1 diguanylate cyclase/phosphodiesterase (LapD/MoxY domain) [Arcobacter aquimarinus]RXI36166.1 diguanylate cyclase [Arcobacter aquimarinus]
MSLYRQVFIVLLFVFTILFILITAVSFNIIKNSAEKSLYENVQNSVTNLSLSITNSGTEISSIKTVINASFDNGNYEKIIFKDVEENIIYELKKETYSGQTNIPQWFLKLVNIDEISAKSVISSGWNVMGIIEIYNDRTLFFEQTYKIFKNLIFTLLISFIFLLVILFYLFNFILKPLKTIEKQAQLVMKNEFILEKKLPFTSEFKALTLSINSMVNKFEKMFENTNNVLKLNKELLYFDEITKLNNRKYFLLKVNDYLDRNNPNNKGYIIVFSLKMEIINKTFGYIKTNEILYNLATLFKNDFENNSNLIARMNGSEFVILIPNIDENNIKSLIENFLSKVYELEDLKEKINLGVCKYDNEESLKNLLIKIDYVISQAKLHTEKKFYFLEDIEKYKSKEEWITIINDSLKNDSFILLYKEIIDINSNEILLKTVDFELSYKEDNFSNKGFIASLVELNKLNEVYFHIINKILKNKESQEKLSIQLPHFLVEDLNNYSDFKTILENNKNKNNFIFEIEEEAFNQNFSNSLMYIKLFKEYNFQFAIYNFIANSDDYSYLKELKPSYIKVSDYFLLESKQSLNMLKILTQSLDIKLIAVTTEKDFDKKLLKEQGINAISNK